MLSADEALKTSAHFSEFVQNPGQAAAAFNIAHKTDLKMWDWYEIPGNEWRSRRFTVVMKGAAESRFTPDLFTNGQILMSKCKSDPHSKI